MRIIITGGSGTIGQRLAKLLGHEGYDVIILSRNPEQKLTNPPSGVRAIKWDGQTATGWGHLLDHHDTVIVNLAGESIASPRWTDAHKKKVLQSRLDSSYAVAEAIAYADHKPKALIQASAIGYYGDGGESVITEDTPPSREWRAQVAVEWEASVKDVAVRTVYLRIGISLDLNGGALPAFIRAADFMGARLGNGRQWVPWIHYRDVTGAIHFLINDQNAHGAFNIVAPQPLRNADFMATVARVRGRPAWFPVPACTLHMAIGEQALFVLDSQRVLPDKLLAMGYAFHFPDADSALRNLLSRTNH